MPGSATDIVVIGGGVIGLSIAYRMSGSNRRITVLDARHVGQASNVAAGMLAPLAESNSLPALAELGFPSLRQYPRFIDRLAKASGIPIELCGPGILRVATNAEDAEQLRASIEGHAGSGFPLHPLSRAEALELEPSLQGDIFLSVLSPAEKHVPPIVLLAALRAACERAGVRLMHGVESAKMEHSGSRWTILTADRSITAETVVVAAGVWTPEMLKPLGIDLPISPLKGQILIVRFPSDHKPGDRAFQHTIYSHGTYLVPRPNGEIVIGATEEPEHGFDVQVTADAAATLRARAEKLVPDLRSAEIVKASAGLRPASPDRLPLIGRISGYDNAYVASGHGRNGILLAPITADMVHDLIVHGVPPPHPVDPARFESSPALQ